MDVKWGLLGLFTLALISCQPDDDDDTPRVNEPTPYDLELPAGFPPMDIPADNPLTIEGVALGKKLFYDPILSDDNTQSCGSCHNQALAFTDNGKRFSVGIDGIAGNRNSMQLINLGYMRNLFWDGRDATLEEQALEPVPNPIEMHQTWPDAMSKLNSDPAYPGLFKAAFGTSFIDSLIVAKALAQFERTLISGDSKFDQSLRGEVLLSESERRGQQIFNSERGDCFHCHAGGRLFTDNQFHNNGLDLVLTDLGLGAVTNNPTDNGKFKTPTLRNIAVTGPFMHDGRFETLAEVINFYSDSVEVNSPNIDPTMQKTNRPGGQLNLTNQEKIDLENFLLTLTDSVFLSNPDFAP